jgi:hypothetical protein
MPSLNEYEAKRIRTILRDLERTTRGKGRGPMLRLEQVPGASAGVVVRGVATRMGIVRLGLEIVHQALDAETLTLIDGMHLADTDVVTERQNLRAIEIVLADDPLLPPESAKGEPELLGLVACLLPTLLIVTTFLVGFVTIVQWLWHLLRSCIGG